MKSSRFCLNLRTYFCHAGAAILLSYTSQVCAYPISQFLGPTQPEYIQEYFNRMAKWYETEFGSIGKRGSPSEKALVEYCSKNLENWGIEASKHFLFRSFWFAHTVTKEHVAHANFFCRINSAKSSNVRAIRVFPLAKRLFTAFSSLKVWGVQIDADRGETTLYWQVDQPKTFLSMPRTTLPNQQALTTLLLSHIDKNSSSSLLSPMLYSETYKAMKLINQGLILAHEGTTELTGPSAFLTDLILSWSETLSLQAPTKRIFQLKEFNLLFMSERGRTIALKHHSDFNQPTLFMSFESFDDYQIIYP